MKKLFLITTIGVVILSTSCYSYTTIVGKGPQTNESVSKWNTYFIDGLIKGTQVNAKDLAGGAEDYSVTTKLSFGNMLVSGLTFGIYSPNTVIVTK